MLFSRSEITKASVMPTLEHPEGDLDACGNFLNYCTRKGLILTASDPHGGKGRHRRFELLEAQLAVVAVYLCQGLGISPEKIEQVILSLRAFQNQSGGTFELALGAARANQKNYGPVKIELAYLPAASMLMVVAYQEHELEQFQGPGILTLELVDLFGRLANIVDSKEAENDR